MALPPYLLQQMFLSYDSFFEKLQKDIVNRLKELKNQWKESKLLPRKKKKFIRKNIELDFRILNFQYYEMTGRTLGEDDLTEEG